MPEETGVEGLGSIQHLLRDVGWLKPGRTLQVDYKDVSLARMSANPTYMGVRRNRGMDRTAVIRTSET